LIKHHFTAKWTSTHSETHLSTITHLYCIYNYYITHPYCIHNYYITHPYCIYNYYITHPWSNDIVALKLPLFPPFLWHFKAFYIVCNTNIDMFFSLNILLKNCKWKKRGTCRVENAFVRPLLHTTSICLKYYNSVFITDITHHKCCMEQPICLFTNIGLSRNF
jgi:hypothetical protein